MDDVSEDRTDAVHPVDGSIDGLVAVVAVDEVGIAAGGGPDGGDTEPSVDPKVPSSGETARPAALSGSKKVKSLIEWVVVIVVALVVALGIRQFVFQPFWIPSGSMEDTLDIGDRVLVNKAAYRFHGVRHGDVVVFEQPDSWPLAESVKDLIKRVIAIPGDEVFIHDCSVWLNGGKLIESYTDGKCTEPAEAVLDPDGDGKFVVPDKMLFVMGDNRTGSTDGRFNGFVPKSDVVGRAFVVIWPRKHWGWL
ncbi:MAG: signal peptidase I [Actinobacteria bacterium]|uniref:signal peptidase I n=1 Tax=freshwater metagenome TaxID=449393 RepID=A0A6J6PBS9_9ZZZZ|nr:signal peptidase I [Actinomycetota bacterium]MSY11779.1 signal peptidase I [Actinomycetota bacterium]MSZ03035.1 signal peptidase I [Actinomycetota bacterium]MTB07117.1 signal peptidase I [Actinomycetota bacterium]